LPCNFLEQRLDLLRRPSCLSLQAGIGIASDFLDET